MEDETVVGRGEKCGKGVLGHQVIGKLCIIVSLSNLLSDTLSTRIAFINTSHVNKSVNCCLTHWGRVTHICVSKVTIIVSDNGLSPGRRRAIFWNNAGILLIGTLRTNFSEILIEILTFSFKKMRLKVSSAKRRLYVKEHQTPPIKQPTPCRQYHYQIKPCFVAKIWCNWIQYFLFQMSTN